MVEPSVVEGLATPVVARLCHVAPSTLNHWTKAGLCGPSLLDGSGRRATRYWSVRDVVVVRAIKSLRDAGCSLRNLEKVSTLLAHEWDMGLAEAVLFWEGGDVLSVDEAGRVISLLRNAGQALVQETVMHHLTFPLNAWAEEAQRFAAPIDIGELRERRERRLEQRGQEAIGRLGG